jgi:hypothetical protein
MQLELRDSIAAGSYEVDPALVAQAMISRMRTERTSAMLVAPEAFHLDALGVDQPDSGPRLDHA